MSDITMCLNKSCQMRDACYRFTARPCPYRQGYGEFAPVNGGCDGFWPMMKPNKTLDVVASDACKATTEKIQP